MKKVVMAALVAIFAITIIISFFMPWAKVSTSTTKIARSLVELAEDALRIRPHMDKLAAQLNAMKQAIFDLIDVKVMTVIKGCDVPTQTRKRSSGMVSSLAEVCAENINALGKKVLLIYLIPFFALVCIVLAYLGMKNILFVAIMGLMSGILSLIGFFKILTTDSSRMMVQISVENGLWQTLWAYLAIFVISIVWIVIDRKKT